MSAQRPQRKESIWVTLAWTLNLIGLGGIAVVAIGYVVMTTSFASAQEAQPISTRALPNTFTPDPNSSLFLPTVTPNPLATRITFQTPTPFVLISKNGNGIRPQIIGYSVAGRPMGAEESSKQAAKWTKIGFFSGLAVMAIYMLLVFGLGFTAIWGDALRHR